jgi:two-component system, cell cycle response regulator DivK
MARVLVVDDHADSREVISLMLQRDGYDVHSAADGREALDAFLYKTPDAVLLDLALPEMDGVRLVQLVRSYRRLAPIPVVVLTGLSTGKLFEEAQSLNVSSFLLKSVATSGQIRSAIRTALTQPRSDARLRSQEKWRGDSISPL